jgi:tol-pal system protein YbgF
VSRARALAGLVLALALAAPAAGQDLRAIDRRIDRLEGEVEALREAAGAEATAAGGGVLSRLDAVESELRALTGRVERLEFRVERLAEDAARRLYDIQFRLTELEGGDLAALPPEPRPLGEGPGSEGPTVSVSERRALEEAVGLVQRGRTEAAEAALAGFLDAYPDSPLAGRARFWQGEARFSGGDFRRAARAYLDGFETDPDGPAAADNLLKLGVSLGRLGRTADACDTLAEVRRRFPGEDGVAEEAAGEARRLGCG